MGGQVDDHSNTSENSEFATVASHRGRGWTVTVERGSVSVCRLKTVWCASAGGTNQCEILRVGRSTD